MPGPEENLVQFSSRQFADMTVAAPVGRIDHAAAGQLEAAMAPLLAQSGIGKTGIVLDFAGVDYISSVGLRVLMIAAKQMRTHGVRIAIAALQPVVAEIFTISRFDSVLQVFPSVRGALEQLSAPALCAFDATPSPPAT
jgi:anti-sigma B factor antagonist/stage II sporulation protein AA (anti-sigma F factor antagonist)